MCSDREATPSATEETTTKKPHDFTVLLFQHLETRANSLHLSLSGTHGAENFIQLLSVQLSDCISTHSITTKYEVLLLRDAGGLACADILYCIVFYFRWRDHTFKNPSTVLKREREKRFLLVLSDEDGLLFEIGSSLRFIFVFSFLVLSPKVFLLPPCCLLGTNYKCKILWVFVKLLCNKACC